MEPEDVPDDAASETAVEDDDEADAEDFSSIAEVESNADNSSADEDDEGGNDTDEDADKEEPFEARDFNIVIPDLRHMPEWEAYQKAVRARDFAGTVCQPIPSCSKDVVNDFCVPCAIKTPGSSATKRSHAVVLDDSEDDDGIESCAKVTKVDRPLISVDLTNDSQSTKPASRVAKSLALSFSVRDEDPLANVNASCSQVLNGIADEPTKSLASGCESLKSQPFVVVDVESILAKKPAKNSKFVRNKGQNGAKIVETPLSLKTESEVTCKDVGGDGVSVSDPGLKDHLKTLSKNGIKIVNVSSKKDSNNTLPVDEKSKGSTNHTENGSEDKTKNESNGSNVKKRCEIIDIEEVTRQEKTVSDTAAQLIKSSK